VWRRPAAVETTTRLPVLPDVAVDRCHCRKRLSLHWRALRRTVVIGSAASQGYYELERIVAVGDGDWRIVPPCGRCRQVLFDYFPTIEVIVRSSDNYLTYSIAELLPETFDWAKQDRTALRPGVSRHC
jgi:cytidine deaminase